MVNPTRISKKQREAIRSGDTQQVAQSVLNSPGMAFVAPEAELAGVAAKGAGIAGKAAGAQSATRAAGSRAAGSQPWRPVNESAVSDNLRQQRRLARKQAGDQALNADSWSKFGRAFKDRPYGKSSFKREQVISKNYRQAFKQAKDMKKDNLGSQARQVAAVPINMATSELLQQAWLNLIDSFGLTLIWINAHVLLRRFYGQDLFCKFGDEWIPRTAKGIPGEGGAMKEGMLLGLKGKSLWLAEWALLIFLDALVGLIILGNLAIYGIIIWIIIEPSEALWKITNNMGELFDFLVLALKLTVTK